MKRAFRVILFGGVVALMGLMIRSCNKQFGWYEANKIELEVEKPLEEAKFRWYLTEPFEMDEQNRIMMPIKYTQLLYDTVLVKPFPRVEDNNTFVLVYDSVWIYPFEHYKLRGETQHTYSFRLSLVESVPYVYVEIEGPNYESFEGAFSSITDSVIIHRYSYGESEEKDVDEVEYDEVEDAVMEREETESARTTDHDAR